MVIRIIAFWVCWTTLLQAQPLDLEKFKNLNIRNVGPANMSGRITAIDVVTSNPNILYVGAASGGVWKSENGGSAWRPVFDDQPTQNIGAVAIQQNNHNIVWVGTGEGNPRNSMNLGMGIFKSLDGGATWKHLGLEKTKTIHRVLIHPRNPDIVYAGASGDPFTPNEHKGLYKTVDGGVTWNKILYTNNQSGVSDLVMDPVNPNKLIAAMYDHRRTPYSFVSGGTGSGLFITYDGGDSWKKITAEEGIPEGELGRIGLAIAPSDPNRIYAKIEAGKNALYRSDDAGHSWFMINDNPRFTNNRPFYFQELAVDSENPNRLYNIYQPLHVSYDGGKSFDPNPMIPADETKGIHADFHAFWVNPNDPKHFIIGGDGGIGITRDHGKSWYFPENIPVAQCYQINVDNDMPYNVYAGMQDNGNWYGPGYTWRRGGIRTLYWQYLVGGDGFYIEPDKDDSRFGYGTSQNGDLYRYDKIGGYYSSIKPRTRLGEPTLRFNWNAAFAQDPHDASTIYYGSQFVHKSTDKGATWEIISPDLSTNNPEHQKGDYGGLTLDISGAEYYNSILAIAPSPIDDQIIWVGTDDGQLHLTKDGGDSWTNLTANVIGLPQEAWIARIQASAFEKGVAWVIANHYRQGDYNPYLFKTDDFGISWKNMTPSSQVRGYTLSVIQDPVEPNLVFLGTEHGLWISIDEGKNWVQFKNGFPSVSTMDLKIQERESSLIVGTFGRAIWVLDDLDVLRVLAAGQLKKQITALPMNEVVQVKGLFINPPGNIWSGFHTTFEGENRVFQKMEIPYFIDERLDTSLNIVATIFNKNNKPINEISSKPTNRGYNYLTWKLDEKSSDLPGAWAPEEYRNIPVLPGEYKIVLQYGDYQDSNFVRVIPDPRFDLSPIVDEQLYHYQKEVDSQISIMTSCLTSIDRKLSSLAKLKKQLAEISSIGMDSIIAQITTIEDNLNSLRALGQTPRPKRQVGAWQSSKVTAYSKIREARQISRSRLRAISLQENQLFEEAKHLILEFKESVSKFQDNEWATFLQQLHFLGRPWLDMLSE